MSGDSFGCCSRGRGVPGIWWAEAREAVHVLQCPGQPPPMLRNHRLKISTVPRLKNPALKLFRWLVFIFFSGQMDDILGPAPQRTLWEKLP